MKFEVPGIPKAKGRPRMTRKGHVYTPAETVSFENLVKVCAREAGIEYAFEGPVSMTLTFVWPAKKLKRKGDPVGRQWKGTRPDLDNCIKAVCDALNGTAYLDDGQVVCVIAEKQYAAQGEAPRTEVRIEAAEPA